MPGPLALLGAAAGGVARAAVGAVAGKTAGKVAGNLGASSLLQDAAEVSTFGRVANLKKGRSDGESKMSRGTDLTNLPRA